jgi:hypothetical protein
MARRPTKTSKTKQGNKTRAKSKSKPKEPLLSGVSPQRRVDIFAIIFLLIGTLTLISLFTQTSGSCDRMVGQKPQPGYGMGRLHPAIGIDHHGRLDAFQKYGTLTRLSPERTVGIFLLFINLTAWFH